MKVILLVAVLLTSGLTRSATMTRQNSSRVLAEFPGSTLKWVYAAEDELKRKQLNLERYRVSVVEEDVSVTVILVALDAPRNAMGNLGKTPGYEVEISKTDLKVLKSHYIR
jgi:hypothetical protein